MDKRTSSLEASISRDLPALHRYSGQPCEAPQETGGKIVGTGEAFVKTIGHFWPNFPAWLAAVPDSRFQPRVRDDKQFLLWWGICLFVFKLGSRRQLDFALRDEDTYVLENINRLAQTNQNSLPVHDTLDHFLGHVGPQPIAQMRTLMIRRLIRMKILDAYRLQGMFVVAVDGTGHLVFHKPHCPHCLVQKHDSGHCLYLHQLLEAKLVTDSGLALSMGTEFVENPLSNHDSTRLDPEQKKQDCELKAFARLAPQLKQDFPQTPICICSDCLFACGTAIQICKDNRWSYIFTFKPGRLPDVWKEFQGLLKLSPQNLVRTKLSDGTVRLYRWVNHIPYQDAAGRAHIFNALQCEETSPQGKTTTFAWITDIALNHNNVELVAMKGGRLRSKIENGFNVQKNSGLNLEHAYSFDPQNLKAFYYLLQIAHIILQLLEKGSLLKQLAHRFGKKTSLKLFGSLKNIAHRLLEAFRFTRISQPSYDPVARFQIRLADTS